MSDKDNLLIKAVVASDTDEAERLLTEGANPNSISEIGMFPLEYAVFRGDEEMVELLLRLGANPNLRATDGTTPLWRAEDDFGLFKIAGILRRYGATDK